MQGYRLHPPPIKPEMKRPCYSSLRNSSGVKPATLAMWPIVKELTGLWRGIWTMRIPSDMVMCLPCRMISNPAFSRARTAWRWLMPGRRGMWLKSDHFALHLHFKPTFNLWTCIEPFPDGFANIGKRLFVRRTLRTTSRQVITPHSDTFSRFHKSNVVVHEQKLIGTRWRGKPFPCPSIAIT